VNLDLETILPRRTGRQAAVLTAQVLRPAEIADLDNLADTVDDASAKQGLIKRLTDRHHALARAIAQGIPKGEAGAMCGYNNSRVSVLMSDPTFKELVDFYRSQQDKIFRGVAEKLSGIASDALDVLEERLEESPQEISTGQLLEIIKVGADRSGHGPQSTTTANVNIHLGLAERMEAARKQALAASQRVIDITPKAAAE
jgi:hypothetical protein